MPIVKPHGSRPQSSVLNAQASSLLTVRPILRSKPLRAPLFFDPASDVDRFAAEIGYWLGEAFWGRGWMTRVVSAFAHWLLGPEAPQEFVRLEARIYEFNPASGRVLEKAGFQFEGRHRKAVFKRGRFADTLCYARVAPARR